MLFSEYIIGLWCVKSRTNAFNLVWFKNRKSQTTSDKIIFNNILIMKTLSQLFAFKYTYSIDNIWFDTVNLSIAWQFINSWLISVWMHCVFLKVIRKPRNCFNLFLNLDCCCNLMYMDNGKNSLDSLTFAISVWVYSWLNAFNLLKSYCFIKRDQALFIYTTSHLQTGHDRS